MGSRSSELEFVQEANLRYYQAVAASSLPDLEDIWLPSEACRCLLPGGPLLKGWNAIRHGWQELFARARELNIQVDRVTVQLEDDRAWLNCRERILLVAGRQGRESWWQASNLFWKRQERWRLVLHHAAPWKEQSGAPRWLQ